MEESEAQGGSKTMRGLMTTTERGWAMVTISEILLGSGTPARSAKSRAKIDPSMAWWTLEMLTILHPAASRASSYMPVVVSFHWPVFTTSWLWTLD